jgi:hypothetical protein
MFGTRFEVYLRTRHSFALSVPFLAQIQLISNFSPVRESLEPLQQLFLARKYSRPLALQSTAEKNVTGKKRQQEFHASVPPPVCGGVEWKKDLESLSPSDNAHS